MTTNLASLVSPPPPPAQSKQIRVGAGISFHVCAETYERAQLAANDTRLTHYLGVLPNNNEVIGCDREALLAMGCEKLVWIAPERVR